MFFSLHRHDEFSSFDGFGKPSESAKLAKELNYPALGITNHGNTHSLIQHYFACKEEEIKPILGVEGYFLPKYKEKDRGYHICIFAKNTKGYENLNRIQTEGEKQKYYNAILDFNILKKYSEGIIVTNACIASYISQALVEGNKKMAVKATKKFKEIYGDDFYFEIQPHAITEPEVQERLNYDLYKLSKEMDVKCILTSDSHYGKKEDFDTYLRMHEIGKHDFFDIEETYGKLYMPSQKEILQQFMQMHGDKSKDWYIPNTKKFAKEMLNNLKGLAEKVDDVIFENLEHGIPEYDPKQNSSKLIRKKLVEGLKKKKKYNKKYMERIKEELNVIEYHELTDYFLIVADYTNWAKDEGITVGAGRGSGCNSLVNYALNITEVDPVYFDLDFSRFMSKERKKMPDIDLDFETGRRGEVIDYLLDKYPNNSAQVPSYGLYKVDNLINDLAKLSSLEDDKETIKEMKKFIKGLMVDGVLDMKKLLSSQEARIWNSLYDDVIIHFSKLYQKVRFISTHAAGVAITKDNILKYTALKYDKTTGRAVASFDLNDLEKIGVEKFDILGLTTMSSIGELRKMTGNESFKEEWANDKEILETFSKGDTDGIFQFDKTGAQDLLMKLGVTKFGDIIAASAMNRPGPLTLGMPEEYATNKLNPDLIDTSKPYSKYLKETYGAVVYQEQVLAIAINIGGLSNTEARSILKMERGGTARAVEGFNKNYSNYLKKFIKGAKRFGMDEEESTDIFDKFFNYSFNKGHSTGYSLISLEEMYYKVYHPTEYWYAKMKYTNENGLRAKFKSNAVSQNVLIFLPHVNYSADDTIRVIEGEKVIQEGLMGIKGIGQKATDYIQNERQKNGVFISRDNFIDRTKNRAVHKGVINKLDEYGALDFNKDSYLTRVTRYNSALYSRN